MRLAEHRMEPTSYSRRSTVTCVCPRLAASCTLPIRSCAASASDIGPCGLSTQLLCPPIDGDEEQSNVEPSVPGLLYDRHFAGVVSRLVSEVPLPLPGGAPQPRQSAVHRAPTWTRILHAAAGGKGSTTGQQAHTREDSGKVSIVNFDSSVQNIFCLSLLNLPQDDVHVLMKKRSPQET